MPDESRNALSLLRRFADARTVKIMFLRAQMSSWRKAGGPLLQPTMRVIAARR